MLFLRGRSRTESPVNVRQHPSLVKDPEVADPIRFLRAREVVHFQRFGEALRSVQDELNSKNFYAFNPSFDAKTFCAAPQPGAGQGNCCTR